MTSPVRACGVEGVRLTDAIGVPTTFTLSDRLTTPTAAVIVAEPAVRAAIVPVRSTVATAGAELVHVTASPRTSPAFENARAVAVVVCCGTSLSDAGDTVIVATGPGTTFTSMRLMTGLAPGWIADTTTGIVL